MSQQRQENPHPSLDDACVGLKQQILDRDATKLGSWPDLNQMLPHFELNKVPVTSHGMLWFGHYVVQLLCKKFCWQSASSITFSIFTCMHASTHSFFFFTISSFALTSLLTYSSFFSGCCNRNFFSCNIKFHSRHPLPSSHDRNIVDVITSHATQRSECSEEWKMGRLTVLHKSLKWDRHPNIIGPNSQENDQLNEYGLNTWGQSGNIRQMETELLLFPREMLFHAQEVWNLLSFSSSTRCCNLERACPPSRWVPYCWFSCHLASSCGCKCCSVRMKTYKISLQMSSCSLTRKEIAKLRYFTSLHLILMPTTLAAAWSVTCSFS